MISTIVIDSDEKSSEDTIANTQLRHHKFKQSDSLPLHKKGNNKKINKCEICDTQFHMANELTEHYREEHMKWIEVKFEPSTEKEENKYVIPDDEIITSDVKYFKNAEQTEPEVSPSESIIESTMSDEENNESNIEHTVSDVSRFALNTKDMMPHTNNVDSDDHSIMLKNEDIKQEPSSTINHTMYHDIEDVKFKVIQVKSAHVEHKKTTKSKISNKNNKNSVEWMASERQYIRKPCTCPNCVKKIKFNGKRIHICEHEGCGKEFRKCFKLRVHQRVHTGEKPYRCEVDHCGKRFMRSDLLIRHRKTHSQYKSIPCPHCDKGFHRSDNLAKHVRRVHKPKKKKNAADISSKSKIENGVRLLELKSSESETKSSMPFLEVKSSESETKSNIRLLEAKSSETDTKSSIRLLEAKSSISETKSSIRLREAKSSESETKSSIRLLEAKTSVPEAKSSIRFLEAKSIKSKTNTGERLLQHKSSRSENAEAISDIFPADNSVNEPVCTVNTFVEIKENKQTIKSLIRERTKERILQVRLERLRIPVKIGDDIIYCHF